MTSSIVPTLVELESILNEIDVDERKANSQVNNDATSTDHSKSDYDAVIKRNTFLEGKIRELQQLLEMHQKQKNQNLQDDLSHVNDDEKPDEETDDIFEDYPIDLPLHQFTVSDICNTLTQWVRNDINYKRNLLRTTDIFNEHKLHGEKLMHIEAEDVKSIVKQKMLSFITIDTLNIIFSYLAELKYQNPKSVAENSTEDIVNTLYNYPLKRLISKIKDGNINGEVIIDILQKEKNNIFQSETGWSGEELEQIRLLFFRYNTLTRKQFVDHADRVLELNKQLLPNKIITAINNIFSDVDIEQIHYSIKNNKNNKEMQTFSYNIINMVDEAIENIDDIRANELVKLVYSIIAQCFVCEGNDLLLNAPRDWECNNCGNYNFNQYRNGKMTHNLKNCNLCGVSHIDSIVLKIRNHDTFIMVNMETVADDDEEREDEKMDGIDTVIKKVIEFNKIDLFCWNRNDSKSCPSILRLARNLIIYKQWLSEINNKSGDIVNTIEVDIHKFIDDKTFKNIFIQSAESVSRITQNNMKSLMKMLDDNVDDIANIETFLKTNRKTFAISIKKQTKMKPAASGKLHKEITKTLKEEAQKRQFGAFLSKSNLNNIDYDYHHILHSHINDGNKNSIKNVFRFYNNCIHFSDTESTIEKCTSIQREQKRTEKRNSEGKNDSDSKESQQENTIEDKDMWTLKQIYYQAQLDVIHSYLVHSNWKNMVQQHTQRFKSSGDNEEIEEEYLDEMEDDNNTSTQNKDKYISGEAEFGFGVVHEYDQLDSIYLSLHDEIINNNQCTLRETIFHNLLIKAINLHKVALSDQYKEILICKKYDPKYQMIRNDPIAIRHVLAIIIYTDQSNFCTAFRKTYRKINNETTEQEVVNRHKQLYNFARCLFEAVEFFGEEMDPKLKVYHGLNCVMNFEKFTEYFNQPLSTTTSFKAAQQFSQGSGIILSLKSAATHISDLKKRPKYLSVSFLSCFPHEDEKLFYGSYVVLQIVNITEATNLKHHTKELKMFDNFQKTVQNQFVNWNNDINMINALCILIKNQQENINNDEKHEFKSEYITKYGRELFSFFCGHPNTTKICIRNFESLPKSLCHALFTNSDISIVPILKLFPNLEEIVLNELDIDKMTEQCGYYINAAFECVNHKYLKRISFKSTRQNDGKQNSTLKTRQKSSARRLKKHLWSVEYEYRIENAHTLTFNNHQTDEFRAKLQRERENKLKFALNEKENNTQTLAQLEWRQTILEKAKIRQKKRQQQREELKKKVRQEYDSGLFDTMNDEKQYEQKRIDEQFAFKETTLKEAKCHQEKREKHRQDIAKQIQNEYDKGLKYAINEEEIDEQKQVKVYAEWKEKILEKAKIEQERRENQREELKKTIFREYKDGFEEMKNEDEEREKEHQRKEEEFRESLHNAIKQQEIKEKKELEEMKENEKLTQERIERYLKQRKIDAIEEKEMEQKMENERQRRLKIYKQYEEKEEKEQKMELNENNKRTTNGIQIKLTIENFKGFKTYGKNKYKSIHVTQIDEEWRIGSKCEIYLKKERGWVDGEIISISESDNKMTAKCYSKKTKQKTVKINGFQEVRHKQSWLKPENLLTSNDHCYYKTVTETTKNDFITFSLKSLNKITEIGIRNNSNRNAIRIISLFLGYGSEWKQLCDNIENIKKQNHSFQYFAIDNLMNDGEKIKNKYNKLKVNILKNYGGKKNCFLQFKVFGVSIK